ncbi:MAG: protein kinase [Pyrinomonadaceae bacterium]
MPLTPGTAFGRYEICRLLGAGGMGEVYLAQDTRLGRLTALKLLSPKLIERREYLQRFEQEARAISALNHPNIITIYEVGEANGSHFIATEFIDGDTLRRHMALAKVPLRDVLPLAIQIGAALTAAHDTGIAHRDIKPENVMLRGDGILKVLDFGLAKLMEKTYQGVADPDLPTIPNIDTRPGSIVGTITYMSPEQLRGFKVDGRTDIWSLGVILHELLSGRPPFEGSTDSDLIVSILEKEPPSLELHVPEAPIELRRIVTKALRKNIEDRYQTATEITADLKRFREDLEYEARRTLVTVSPTRVPRRHAKRPEGLLARTVLHGALSTDEVIGGRTTSSIEYIFTEIRKHRALTTGLLVFLTLSLFYLWHKGLVPQKSQSIRMDHVTNSGRARLAAISPDGKYVVYAESEGATEALFMRHGSSTSTATLVPSAEVRHLGLTFSPDGDYVYFVRYEKTHAGVLYRIPLLGGLATKVMENIDSPVTFSPDARRLAFVRFNESEGEYVLTTADIDGSKIHPLARRNGGADFSRKGLSWSADGKKIACAAGSWEGGYHTELIEIDATTGVERKITSRRWFYALQLAWLPDGTGLYVCAAETQVSPRQIWKISSLSGKSERMTHGLNNYDSISLSGDGQTIVTVQNYRASKIWVAQGEAFNRMMPIVTGVGSSYGLNWTRDQRIIYSAMSGNNLNIFSVKSDGTDKKQLTIDAGDNYHPSISADGRYILFSSSRTGAFNIWRMDAQDGGNLRQLTNGEGDFHPHCAPDGEWVIYERQKSGPSTLWKVPLDGGPTMQLTTEYTAVPAISPDGQMIACRYYTNDGLMRVAIISINGGTPLKLLPIPPVDWQKIRWTPDSRALTYVDDRNNVYNIMRQPIDGSSPQQLTNFQSEQIFSYDWSPDFSQLACERGAEYSDVVTISNE